MTLKLPNQSAREAPYRALVVLAVGLCGLPVVLQGAQPAAAPPKATPAPAPAILTEVEIPQSVFVDDMKKGKDPFFPNSRRRIPNTAVTPTTEPKTNTGGTVVIVEAVDLRVKGIAGTTEKRLAIINDTTIAVGETLDIKAGVRKHKVHCWEIRSNSVIISVDGAPERKEVFLRGE